MSVRLRQEVQKVLHHRVGKVQRCQEGTEQRQSAANPTQEVPFLRRGQRSGLPRQGLPGRPNRQAELLGTGMDRSGAVPNPLGRWQVLRTPDLCPRRRGPDGQGPPGGLWQARQQYLRQDRSGRHGRKAEIEGSGVVAGGASVGGSSVTKKEE